jgi:hypothetical protein
VLGRRGRTRRQSWWVTFGALLVAGTIVEAASPVDTAAKFLVAWGKGDWVDLATVAAKRVTLRVDGKEFVIDVGARKTDVTLVLPFKGLSTVRTGDKITGVHVADLTVTARGAAKKGQGTLTLEERDGKTTVVKLAVQ